MMATIDDKSIIDKLIANNGHYDDDPQVYMIVEYTNSFGVTTWGVTWLNDRAGRERYLVETEYVQKPKVIWSVNIPNPQFCRDKNICGRTGKCEAIRKYDRSCND